MILNAQKEYEPWLLTGSQRLYGDDTLQSVARHSMQIAEALDPSGAFSARIVGKPILTGPDAEQVSLAANAAEWQDFARMAGVEVVRLGADLDLHALRNELRWNDLAFKLGR